MPQPPPQPEEGDIGLEVVYQGGEIKFMLSASIEEPSTAVAAPSASAAVAAPSASTAVAAPSAAVAVAVIGRSDARFARLSRRRIIGRSRGAISSVSRGMITL